MFGEVFRFELRYQLTRKSTWFYFLAFSALLLQLTKEAFFDQARAGGYFFNAPHVMATASVLGGLFGMILTAAIAGDAATRDTSTRMAPLMYTTPVGKAAYLGGRFLAAFVTLALLMLAIPLVQWGALLLPGLDQELIAPFNPAGYALSYGSLVLPTVFATAALMFTAAVLTRRATSAFLVAAGLFLSTLFTNAILAQTKGYWALARLLDPFAFTAMNELSRARTALQKATMLVGAEPNIIANRALWLLIGVAVLGYAYARFGFVHEEPRGWLAFGRKRTVADPLERRPEFAHAPLPAVRPRFDIGARLRQVWAIAGDSFRTIALSRGAIPVVAIAVIIAVTGSELNEHLGVPLVPVTGFIAAVLGSATDAFGFVGPLICVFYAGELVWREREAGLGPIADATPLPDWLPLLGKGLGLGLALAAWNGLLILAGVTIQLLMGHTILEPLLWLQTLLGFGLSGHLLFAVLAIAIHVLVNHKYTGHLVALAAYALILFAPAFGIEHKLLVYGATPEWRYTDLQGYGLSVAPVLWFKLYWAGWALLLAVAARLWWVRGPETGLRQRWAFARERTSRPVLAATALAALTIVGAGGFVFHNTNVRNEYVNGAQRELRQVEYERKYSRYADAPRPSVMATKLAIELYPDAGRATVTGRNTYVNDTSKPIDTLHVETSAKVATGPLRFDRAATVLSDDTRLHHQIIRLEKPLQPRETLAMDFELEYGGHGFTNAGRGNSIAPKASHFEQDWLPVLGYQRALELNDEVERRKHGLPPRPEIPQLDDVAARHDLRGLERVQVDVSIGTVPGQVAVAPGRLVREWAQHGRRYFQYTTDDPIRNEYGIYSANYVVHESRWRDVAIRVYTHPAHQANVPRFVHSVQASLERFTRQLGPYPAKQLTVVEAPGFGVGAHAHPTSIRISEGYALMNPAADWRRVDFVFAVMAHELAHQWWGNQLAPASVAGAPFVAESMAWYGGMGVVEQVHGRDHLDRLLGVMRADELTPRARDGIPLLESQNFFTAYRLGPFSMLALREYVGEAAVDRALRRFFDKYKEARAPLPTSLELYAELKAVTPPAQHEFLADLFERNTFWDLKTKAVSARPVGQAWEVTLDVVADKVSVDKAGKETPRPLREAVEIGVYGPGEDGEPGQPLYLRKHPLLGGAQRLTVTVPSRPAFAGIDPRSILIDTKREDNTLAVKD